MARIVRQIDAMCDFARDMRAALKPAHVQAFLGRFGFGARLSENRGVPGSSPGLAIRKPREHHGFLLSGVPYEAC
jgi:hypothetical protein